MGKYRKKPVVINAFKWTGDELQTEDPEWAIEAIKEGKMTFKNKGTPEVTLNIQTLEGTMEVTRGDYIIQGVENELYPCKPGIFHKTYDEVEGVDTIGSGITKIL